MEPSSTGEGCRVKLSKHFYIRSIEYMHLDLGDLKSVGEFVEEFSKKYTCIDTVLYNMGAVYLNEVDHQGFDRHFSVNYLGPFYLTTCLLPLMREHPESRIITTANNTYK